MKSKKIQIILFLISAFLLLAPSFVFAKPGASCTSHSQCGDTKGSYCVILSSGNGVCGNPGESCASDKDCTKPQTCNTSTNLCFSPAPPPQCPSGQTYDVQQKKCVTVTLSPTGGACCVGMKSGEITPQDCKDVTPNTQCSAFNNATTGVNYNLQKKPCAEIGNCSQATAAGRGFTPTPPTPFVPIVPKLQINIPTVQFSNITKEGQMLGIPFLAEYISGVYKYAVGIVSIIAIVVVMIGGLRWLTAGGNSGAITQARQLISNASIGLILTLGSYILLYSINPDLVNFKALRIQYVEPKPIWTDITDEQLKENAGGAVGAGSNNVPYFIQWGAKAKLNTWAEKRCGPNPSDTSKNTIEKAGCGLTSMAMILKYYFPSQNIDPGVVSLLSSSCAIPNASRLSKGPWGSVALDRIDLTKTKKLLSEGKPVLFNCRHCVGFNPKGILSRRKYEGHVMVLTGYNNGTFSVNDPGGNDEIRIASMTEEMVTNPCKFVYPSDDNKSASGALKTCNKKNAAQTKGKDVDTNPFFWYLRPAGK